jgi:hypothetical protein
VKPGKSNRASNKQNLGILKACIAMDLGEASNEPFRPSIWEEIQSRNRRQSLGIWGILFPVHVNFRCLLLVF